jgi:hypothetical protein
MNPQARARRQPELLPPIWVRTMYGLIDWRRPPMSLDMGRFLGSALIALGLVTAASSWNAEAAIGRAPAGAQNVQQATTCGKPGTAPCPLQAFMRTRVATPLTSSDAAALTAGLERAAALAPDPSWNAWGTFARAGAEAARKGDTASVRAACKGCHDAFRETYRAKYRTRPIPQ